MTDYSVEGTAFGCMARRRFDLSLEVIHRRRGEVEIANFKIVRLRSSECRRVYIMYVRDC